MNIISPLVMATKDANEFNLQLQKINNTDQNDLKAILELYK